MSYSWDVGGDDVDRVVESNTSQVVTLPEVTMNLVLCQSQWSSPKITESKLFMDMDTSYLHFRVIHGHGHIEFKTTVGKNKDQPQVAICQS